ncbi:hypothetical protein K491DRAFT_697897 [Lophiostoma macrostomum CBS 122681]|uniref:Uncharacterized protein n=1 Tax=Lophiostoma macrostomum CBS 122681 TaxID=1314788 RepID=A0A6A6SQ04_9PLEO|nr:hypothetical protein K491DRAFT_697897 [Lophiostoma macrostomum CBS 122681]
MYPKQVFNTYNRYERPPPSYYPPFLYPLPPSPPPLLPYAYQAAVYYDKYRDATRDKALEREKRKEAEWRCSLEKRKLYNEQAKAYYEKGRR